MRQGVFLIFAISALSLGLGSSAQGFVRHNSEYHSLVALAVVSSPLLPVAWSVHATQTASSNGEEEKRRMLAAVVDDASAFLAGQEASSLLSMLLSKARSDLATHAGEQVAARTADQDIVFEILDEIRQSNP